MGGRTVVSVAVATALVGCSSPSSPPTTLPVPARLSTTGPAVTSTTPPTTMVVASTTAAPQERWIEVVGDHFVDTRTGEVFVPLGVNLLRKTGGGGPDRLFQGNYDPQWVDEQLAGITDLGFNTVRFFLDMCMQCHDHRRRRTPRVPRRPLRPPHSPRGPRAGGHANEQRRARPRFQREAPLL